MTDLKIRAGQIWNAKSKSTLQRIFIYRSESGMLRYVGLEYKNIVSSIPGGIMYKRYGIHKKAKDELRDCEIAEYDIDDSLDYDWFYMKYKLDEGVSLNIPKSLLTQLIK